ncbi:uncharacterized protein LOC144102130 [Amblyomma americanum]
MGRLKSTVIGPPNADYDEGLNKDTMGELLPGAYLQPPPKAEPYNSDDQQLPQESTSGSSMSLPPRQQQLLDDAKTTSPSFVSPSPEKVDSVPAMADADASRWGPAEPAVPEAETQWRLPSAGNSLWRLRTRCCFMGSVCRRCRWRRLAPGAALPPSLRRPHSGLSWESQLYVLKQRA